MDLSSPEMAEIRAAAMSLHRGEADARARLLALWDAHAAAGARLEMCAIAHVLADGEAEAADELEWDLRALEAATGGRAAEDVEPVSPEFLPLMASLHGSVGSGYARLRDLARARRHVGIAMARSEVLADDAYGRTVRDGLRRLQAALGMTG